MTDISFSLYSLSPYMYISGEHVNFLNTAPARPSMQRNNKFKVEVTLTENSRHPLSLRFTVSSGNGGRSLNFEGLSNMFRCTQYQTVILTQPPRDWYKDQGYVCI